MWSMAILAVLGLCSWDLPAHVRFSFCYSQDLDTWLNIPLGTWLHTICVILRLKDGLFSFPFLPSPPFSSSHYRFFPHPSSPPVCSLPVLPLLVCSALSYLFLYGFIILSFYNLMVLHNIFSVLDHTQVYCLDCKEASLTVHKWSNTSTHIVL